MFPSQLSEPNENNFKHCFTHFNLNKLQQVTEMEPGSLSILNESQILSVSQAESELQFHEQKFIQVVLRIKFKNIMPLAYFLAYNRQ